jgi:hypothetical protein
VAAGGGEYGAAGQGEGDAAGDPLAETHHDAGVLKPLYGDAR